MSLARKMRRAQARQMTNSPEFAKAVGSLKGLRPAIDDTQTAVVQVLGELDMVDLELRRQRAVFLRMVMEMKGLYAQRVFAVTNQALPPFDPSRLIDDVMEMEEQYRLEFDVIFSLVGWIVRLQADAEPKSEES